MSKFYAYILTPLLFFCFSLVTTSDVQASHGMGADLTFECIGNNEYKVRLKFYRDCLGISYLSSQTVTITGCGVTTSMTLSMVGVPIEVSPLCPSQASNSSCQGGSLPGVQEATYEGTVTLNNPCANYTLGWTQCCRNGAITTLNNPSTQNIYISTTLNNIEQPCNNSPVFNNIPTPYVCVNQLVGYNHGVTDPDGDSLVFSLVNCRESAGGVVSYGGGYSGTVPLSTVSGVSINSTNGQISFTPDIVQIGVLCVLVEEYRNGVKIGETVRDMQFVVLNCTNTIPVSSEIYENGTNTGSYIYEACPGQSFCIDILISDLDGDIINTIWNQGIPNGTFTVTNNNSTSPSATFCWAPTASDIGTHFFTVTTNDDSCPISGFNTLTYTIEVRPSTEQVDAGPDQLICLGESATLSASSTIPGATYTWTPTTGLSNPNGQVTQASPTTTTTYTVTASLPGSTLCPTSDAVTVVVEQPPLLNVTPQTISVCAGGSVILTATSVPGATFEWFNGPTSLGTGTVVGNVSTYVATSATTTTYTVVATSPTNCESSEDVTVTIGTPPIITDCSNIYVTTTGNGAGTQTDPASLLDAVSLAGCSGSVLKIAQGVYNINSPIQIPSYITFEGGFDPTTWVKFSTGGLTRIHRTALGDDGIPTGPSLIAFTGNSATGFLFQDITITTANGPDGTAARPAFSTYGVHLLGCSNFDFVRTQIIPGKAGDGLDGSTPTTNVANGESAAAGLNGRDDTDTGTQHGARGGAGGGAGGGTRGWNGTWGCTMPNGSNSAGCNGFAGGNSTAGIAGGGGGGGGGGGQEGRDGGRGGNGGSVPAIPGGGAIAANTTYGGPNALGSCKTDPNWGGQESGCNGASLTRFSAESGRCGRDGVDGSNGMNGNVGTAGTFSTCFFVPGGQGITGDRGQGGQGGSGGGGGAGEGGTFCTDGSGSAGGGGGGGGEGGYGGTGGRGGGIACGILLASNGTGGNVIQSRIPVTAALRGLGGTGGTGSLGGNGGNGGLGGIPVSDPEVGFGGHGGRGGDGGRGGNGGNGQNGNFYAVRLCSGNPLSSITTTFPLHTQPTITVENINCTFSDVGFTALSGSNTWNLGAGAVPLTPTGASVVTQYATLSRKNILHGTNSYLGFHNISFDAGIRPEITTNAPQIAPDTFELCVGDAASFQTNLTGTNYIWDFDGAIPGIFTGPNFQNIPPQVFNNPNPPGVPYAITLALETDCCGLSPMDTIWLYVDPVPQPTITGNNLFCEGGSTILTVNGANIDSIIWAPSNIITVLSPTTAEVVVTTGPVTVTVTTFYESDRPGSSVTPKYTCPQTATYTINTAPPATVTVTPIQIGACDFGAIATVTPAAPPNGGSYTYVWNTGGTSPNIGPIPAGYYTVTVTDTGSGCVSTAGVSVPSGPNPNPYIVSSSNITCNGDADGSATAADANNVSGTFNWSGPGGYTGSGTTINNLAPGTYCVTVTSNSGCAAAAVCVDIYEPTAIDIVVEEAINPTCQNTRDGYIEINASGGVGTYTYEWSPINSGADTLQNIPPGTYTITVTDGNGCSATEAITLSPQSTLGATVTVNNNVSCNGASDGSITANPVGGIPAYTYEWDTGANGQTTQTASGLGAGTYTVTITDSNGCEATASAIITEPTVVSVTASVNGQVACNGGATGSATATATGGTPGYTYNWNNGQTNPTATGLTAGTYTVTATDTNNCTATTTVIITEPTLLSATATIDSQVSCNGGATGSATAAATGGTPGYSYNWNNGQTNPTATGLGAGTYTVTVTDSNGCTDIATATITEPTLLTASTTVDSQVSCNGGADGSATASATGGTPGYSYNWNNGQTNPTATGLGAGTYTVTVTDSNGCTDIATTTITEPTLLSASTTIDSQVSCDGGSDGSATATATGGTPGYSYNWNDGQTNPTATGLGAGTYTVTVTDTNGCTDIATATITEPSPITISTTVDGQVSCNGGANGSATATATGGTPGYSYNWNDGQTTPTATGLTAGTYTVTATDSNGCFATGSVSITEPTLLSASTTVDSQVSCNGGADGSATATATGGTPGYSYNWNDGQTNPTATGLSAGTYTVTVTDTNGCTDIATATITEPTLLSASTTIDSQVSCNGDADGSATVTATGGTPGYSYNWNDGQTNPTATGLGAGTYTVTVTDSNGCTDIATATITEPTLLSASASVDNQTSCNGGSDGAATATATGGTPGYSYNWNDGQTNPTATGLGAGTYSVTVTDSNGCTDTATISITEPSPIVVSTAVDNQVSCNGVSDGSATATASNGTPGYTYEWSANANGQMTATATGLGAGTYTVTATDSNGCFATGSVTITEPTLLSAAATVDSQVSCNGGADGSATATATGGTPGYSYNWNDGQTNPTATGLSAGNYTVTVTDTNGCTDIATATITEPTILSASTTIDSQVSCNGDADGSATVTATGGTPGYSYNWNDGQTNPTATGLGVGTYTVTVTDSNGCTDITTATITEPTLLSASASVDNQTSCNGGSDGAATATATGGTPGYSYNWNDGQTNPTATGLSAGTYSVTVTDSNGCTDTATISITEPSPIVVSTVVDNQVSCNGGADGSVTATASNGTPGYTYEWSANANGQMTATATGLGAGTYTVTATDSNGCFATGSATITEPTLLSAAATVDSQVSCNGGADGSATATATGGTPGYSYNWNDGQTNPTATGLSAGTYTVTVTDTNGCMDIATATITEPTLLSASTTIDSQVSCNGGATGSATVTATGGTPGYSYNWNDGQTNPTATGLGAGTYTVTVTDTNGCTDIATATITEPTLLSVVTNVDNQASCSGGADGSATASATGGTPGYTYNWNNGQTTPTATGLNAGSHQVTVTDSNGCTATANVVITQPTPVTATATVDAQPACNGSSDGSATAAGGGGTPTYTFNWNDGQTTATATGLGAGSYIVTVSDSNGCSATASVSISDPAALTASAQANGSINCNGDSNGTATASATGGTPGYTYNWNNGQNTAIAINLGAGAYTVTVTDNNGCTDIASVTISEPTLVVATISASTDVSCNAGADGTATAQGTGGTPGYTYTWNDGQTNPTATGLMAGTYTVTVSDTNGCQAVTTATITEPTAISATATEDNAASCNGGADGSATATGNGGTPAYTFNWDAGANNQTTATATGLSAGTYTVTVSDANGCPVTAQVVIGEPSVVTASVVSNNDVTCNAGNDGSATVTPGGGTPGYTVIWTNGTTTTTATNLDAGTHVVTVTDTNGCSATASVSINQPTPIVLSATQDSGVTCNGLSDGVATVTASGGTPGYSYNWDNGGTTSTVNNLPAGTHSITVTDTNGCTAVTTVTITQPNALQATAVQDSPVSCFGGADGTATVTVSGGTNPFTYQWDNGGTTPTVTNLPAGPHTVTVTDDNNCSTIANVMITQPPSFSATIPTSTDASCTSCIGTATLTVSGGTPAFTYEWSNGSILQNPTNLCAGLNLVTVTDNNGCTTTASVSIGNSTSFAISAIATNQSISCNSVCDGIATVTATGGATPYTYNWSNGDATPGTSNLCAGTFTVTVTDDNGCTDITQIVLSEPSILGGTTTVNSNSSCFGTSDGSATVNGTGGTSPYVYTWSNGNGTATATGLGAGTYTITITDTNSCSNTTSVSITQPTELVFTAVQNNGVSCFGDSDGSATVSGAGGVPGYSYLWDNGATVSTVNNLDGGPHSVTVTDATGCFTVATVTISEPSLLSSSATLDTGVSCFGQSDGSATVTTTGGTNPYTIIWDNNEMTATATGLNGGVHTVTVTDNNGCASTASVNVTEPPVFAVSVPSNTPANCSSCDGTATIAVSGGTAPFTYQWSNGTVTTTATNLCTGINTVTVTDSNNCTAVTSVNIGNNSTLGISGITIDATNACNGDCDGASTVSVSGGTTPYSYNWSNGQTVATATGLCAGSYTVTVSDVNGCASVDIVNITEPTLLTGTAIELMPVSCFGGSDGIIQVTPNGGTPTYTYNWNTGEMTSTVTGLTAGNYTVTITDTNGCTATAGTTVNQPPTGVTIAITGQTPSNCTACDGTVDITPTGGSLPYIYIWSNGSVIEDPSNLCQGTNTVTVTDANGCSATAAVLIGNTSTLVVFSENVDANVTCFGGCDGAATVTVTGGQTPYLYQWDIAAGGQTTPSATGLCAGTYFVTISDANGCLVAEDITITEPAQLLPGLSSSTSVSCNGDSDGTASVTPSGGTPGYTYNWNTGASTAGLSNLPAGTYSVTVTDTNGCTATASATITEPGPISASATGEALNCFGNTDGDINLTVSGGTLPYSFNWSGGLPAVEDPAGLPAGTYTVTVTDDGGCSVTASASITEPTQIIASTTQSSTSCGGCNGVGTISASGGTPGYTYNWSNGQTGTSATGLCPGNYTITVTDNNNCELLETITISQPTTILVTTTFISNVSCNGGSDGSASATGSAGTPPYGYQWTSGEVTSTATGLSAGVNFVTVTDANGCFSTGSVMITEPAAIQAGLMGTNVSCNGLSDGNVISILSGGTPGYFYDWSTGGTAPGINNVGAGTYTVTITDANGCIAIDSITLTEPGAITASAQGEALNCFGNTDGDINLTVSGGTLPYSFNWSGGLPAVEDPTGLPAGTYTVTVTDDGGCSVTASASITEPTPIIASTTQSSTSCGGCNGVGTISASGGTPGYTYNWSNGQTGTSATGLCPGNYTITVTDNNNCELLETITISQPTTILVTTTFISNVSCNGGSDGSASATGSNGTLPYGYQWTSGEVTSTATGLSAGMNFVTVTDANGCFSTGSVMITEPAAIQSGITATNVSCNGLSDGSVSVAVTGGTPTYTYSWNTGGTGTSINNLPAGTYTVTITDANGCSVTDAATLTQPGAMTASAIGELLSCFGDTDGDINLTVLGGTPPFAYNWSGGAPAVEDPFGLTAGTYTVTVTDGGGCTVTASASITQPTQMTSSTSQSSATCGGCNGVASISLTGGTPGYTYIWNNGQTGGSATGLCPGNYDVTATDNNGCTLIETVTISQPTVINVSATVTSNVSCNSGSDGSATATMNGGNAPFSFLWDNGETVNPAVNLTAGTHTVTVTDASGCFNTASVNITEPTAILVTTISTNITCNGNIDGTAGANATGGVAPYTYAWTGGLTGPAIVSLPDGTYDVTATDSNGCTAVASVIITQPAVIVTSITGTDELCSGGADGTGTVTAQGGVAPFTYVWDNGETSNPATGLDAGTHMVSITDANGCTAVESILIGSGAILIPSVVSSAPTCAGLTNGTATASANGGAAPYTYTWNTNPVQTGATINNLPSGPVVLDIVDANGCSVSVNVNIDNAPTQIGLTITGTDVTCFGSGDGTATVVATGGTPSYTYIWSNGSTGSSAFNLTAGNYTVSVTDANGCSEVITVGIAAATQISAAVNSSGLSCFGETNGVITVDTATISGGSGPYLYSLNGVDYVLNHLFVGLPGGTYTLYIKDVEGCVVSYPVTVSEPAELMVDLGPDIELELGDSVTLSPMIAPLGTPVLYEWTPNQYINCTDCPNPTSTPLENITYTLMVVDTFSGCTAEDEVSITVDKTRDIYIPNAFTPNGDGTNDVFMIYSGSGVQSIRTFKVFDRWGELVFEAANFQPNDAVFGWDGRFKGKLLNPAVYVYYTEVEFIDGAVEFYKGDVTLIK